MDRYEARLKLYGVTQRERNLNRLQQTIAKDLPHSLSCKEVQINSVNRQLNFTETKTGYDIQSLPNETFSVGDYVIYKTLTYLITKVNGDDEVYTKGSMQLCNYTLKFQSPNGTILSYPCIDETNSTVGVDVNNTLTVPNAIHTIKLPFDANTIMLREDRRLFIDRDIVKPRSYKITKVNSTEFAYGDKGLIELTLEQTVGDYPNDRIDLGICDYFEPGTTPTPPPVGDYKMIISTSGQLVIGGLQRVFTSKLIDSEGVEQNFTAVWSFNYNGMPESDFTIDTDGNQCLVKVIEDYDIIDNVLVLTCTTDDGLYTASYDARITA